VADECGIATWIEVQRAHNGCHPEMLRAHREAGHGGDEPQEGLSRQDARRGGRSCDLKPLNVIQRVRLPPGRGQLASRKPALRVSGNTKREA
jgi:hypothetical protein